MGVVARQMTHARVRSKGNKKNLDHVCRNEGTLHRESAVELAAPDPEKDDGPFSVAVVVARRVNHAIATQSNALRDSKSPMMSRLQTDVCAATMLSGL